MIESFIMVMAISSQAGGQIEIVFKVQCREAV